MVATLILSYLSCSVLQPGSQADIGPNSTLAGSIVAYGEINLSFNVKATSTLVALNAALSLNTNDVTSISNACV